MSYPKPEEIRASLRTADEDRVIALRFHVEALKVCDEADLRIKGLPPEGLPKGVVEMDFPSGMDIQTIAKLQFIAKVLEG